MWHAAEAVAEEALEVGIIEEGHHAVVIGSADGFTGEDIDHGWRGFLDHRCVAGDQSGGAVGGGGFDLEFQRVSIALGLAGEGFLDDGGEQASGDEGGGTPEHPAAVFHMRDPFVIWGRALGPAVCFMVRK